MKIVIYICGFISLFVAAMHPLRTTSDLCYIAFMVMAAIICLVVAMRSKGDA